MFKLGHYLLNVRGPWRFPFSGCRTRRAGGCGPNTRTLRRVRIHTRTPRRGDDGRHGR